MACSCAFDKTAICTFTNTSKSFTAHTAMIFIMICSSEPIKVSSVPSEKQNNNNQLSNLIKSENED